MNKKQLILLFSILLLALPFKAQTDDLTGINCAILPSQLLGQANVGYVGAANVGYVGAGGQTIEEAGLVVDAVELLANQQFSLTGSEQVAILIVDDFSSEQPSTDEEFLTTSHGWLVLAAFEQMKAVLPEGLAAQIHLENVDLADDTAFRSDLIRLDLETVIADLQAQGINRFVVNMSFVFVGCESSNFNYQNFLEHRQNNPNHSILDELGVDKAYVQSVLNDNRIARMDERGFTVDNRRGGQGNAPSHVAAQLAFLNLFEVSQLQSDTLRDFFRDSHDYTLIPVASSGNFKWKRPFYPARWAEVISVSATMGASSDLWAQSNDGEVSTAGAWFLLGEEFYTAGTSFAAPVVSMMIALDQTQEPPLCGFQGNAPQLTSNGQYNNLPLLQAVSARCR